MWRCAHLAGRSTERWSFWKMVSLCGVSRRKHPAGPNKNSPVSFFLFTFMWIQLDESHSNDVKQLLKGHVPLLHPGTQNYKIRWKFCMTNSTWVFGSKSQKFWAKSVRGSSGWVFEEKSQQKLYFGPVKILLNAASPPLSESLSQCLNYRAGLFSG